MKTFSAAAVILWAALTGIALAGPTIDTDGSYAVTSVAAAGDVIAVGHFDGSIRIFDPSSSKHVRTLAGHSKPVTSVSSDSRGKYILSASQEGKLILWNAENGSVLRRMIKPGLSIKAAALSPGGTYAAVVFSSEVYVFDTATWENIAIWENAGTDVYCLAIDGSERLAALTGKNGAINLYSLPDGDPVKKLKGGREVVVSAAFAGGSDFLITGGYDKIARVWNVKTGETVRELSRHTDTVRAVAASENGRYFVTAGDDGAVYLWDMERGGAETYSAENSPPVTSLAADPSLRFLAAGKGAAFENSKYVSIWFPSNRKQSRTFYAFADATVVISSLGYVDGSGNFADYVSIHENGRKLSFSQAARKYHRPERLKITLYPK